MNTSKEHKLLDAWKTDEYLFSKRRGDIDYIIATRLADEKVFIVENDIIKDFLSTDKGLDAALEDEKVFGNFLVIRLSDQDLLEDYSRVNFCGMQRRIEFNFAGVDYFNEAEAILNKDNDETSTVYQLNCFAALVFAGFKGYEKLYNLPTDLTIKRVVMEIGLANKSAIAKIQGVFRDTIKKNPSLGAAYGFTPFQ